MRKLCICFIMLVILLSLTACNGNNPLIGYWVNSDGEFYHFDVETVTSGVYGTEAIENSIYTYKINNGVIELKRNGTTYLYNYTLNTNDSMLTLSPVSDPSEITDYYGTDSIMYEEILIGLRIQNS